MFIDREQRRDKRFYRALSFLLMVAFGTNVVFPPSLNAQMLPGMMPLSAPANLLASGPAFVPALIKGLRIHPDNPLQFDFIIDTGDSGLKDKALAEESTRMVKYFLAALTVPEDELWVNLSPVEADRVIPDSFGATDMGMDLLAQDYILKQLTASLVYPEKELGKKFWERIYAQAQEKFGTTDIALDNFNKVWIVPEQAAVYENGEHVFVMNSHLKVMMEEDYAALQHNLGAPVPQSTSAPERVLTGEPGNRGTGELTQQIMREIVIPALEKEVNEGSHFAKLRQINQAAILAKWYKQALRESLLGKVYVDQNKTKGIDTARPEQKETIYEQYLEAFRKGIYDYIKEDVDPQTKEMTARRYFSGGLGLGQEVLRYKAIETGDGAMLGSNVIPIQDERDLPRGQRAALHRAVLPFGNVVRTVFALAENPLTAQSAETDSAMLASQVINDLKQRARRPDGQEERLAAIKRLGEIDGDEALKALVDLRNEFLTKYAGANFDTSIYSAIEAAHKAAQQRFIAGVLAKVIAQPNYFDRMAHVNMLVAEKHSGILEPQANAQRAVFETLLDQFENALNVQASADEAEVKEAGMINDIFEALVRNDFLAEADADLEERRLVIARRLSEIKQPVLTAADAAMLTVEKIFDVTQILAGKSVRADKIIAALGEETVIGFAKDSGNGPVSDVGRDEIVLFRMDPDN
ncbi:MAG TPA: hypothetical protein VLJ10_02710, partial [Candidatus Bathyarchaeia archaeon]|nr:hypothetical protein [Candidatus Bathyarchaeia archaeon]